jgi:hypothetical protein
MKMSNNKIIHMENWLTILINTYRNHPSNGLAKVINFYIDRIINDDDLKFNRIALNRYCSMKKFWAWRSH